LILTTALIWTTMTMTQERMSMGLPHNDYRLLLADVEFTAPVTVEDCATLYSLLKQVSQGCIEVYCHRNEEVVIRVDGFMRRVQVT